jgi:putative addiction module killer protein
VYYAMLGRTCVLLLCGGDKRRQASDIKRAIEYLEDFKERTRSK